MTATEHYNAFISYRHNSRDSLVAQAIQSGLEHFAIPPSVKKQTGIRRIDRVFRDKEELPLTRDLGENIDRALQNSEYLIVICSPELQESRWCMREIEVFLSTHTKNQVLTVVTEGEPSDVIPSILMEETVEKTDPESGIIRTETVLIEPLSCDFRKPARTGSRRDFKEARKTELPRLAAVLLGCTYDELIRRRHQYVMRRFLIASLAVAVTAAAAIGYLLWSRNQIQTNYNQALINQSRELALKSKDALDDEDRVNAVRLAMEALPQEDLDRPVIAEAEYALTEALGVYSTGQSLKGTWIFEARDRITSCTYSPDGKYLLAMDRSGALTVWDIATRERIAVWEINRDEDIPSFIVLPDSRALIWRGNIIFVMDYLTGDQVWVQSLRYSGITASLSTAGNSIFVENRHDLYKIDLETGEFLDTFKEDAVSGSGYYYGIRTGPDDSAALVQLCLSGEDKESIFYIWDLDGNTLKEACPDTTWHNVSQFGWADSESVYICHQNGSIASYASGNIISIADDPLKVSLVHLLSGQPRWETSMISSSISTQTMVSPVSYRDSAGIARHGLLLAYGQTVATLDLEKGDIFLRRDLGESVLGFLEVASDHYLAALGSGQVALVNYQPNTIIYYKQFASGIDSVMLNPANSIQNQEVIVMHSGDVLLYESAGSSTYTACTGDAGLQPLIESVICNDTSGKCLVTLTQEPSLLITDIAAMRTSRISLPGSSFDWRLFSEPVDNNSSESHHVILACNNESLSFYSLDLDTSKLTLLSTDTPLSVDHGLFYASYGHLFSQQGNLIYYSDEDHKIRKFDMVSGSISSVTLHSLSKSQHLQNAYHKDLLSYSSLIMPAPVFVSDQGKYALTTIYDDKEGTSSAALVDLVTGTVIIPEKLLYDGILSAAFDEAQEKVAISGNFLINIYDMQGNIITQISHAGRKLLSLSWYRGELLALYSDKVLERYDENGRTLGSTQLVFSDTLMGIYENIDWTYTTDKLYLQIDTDLCIINMSDWPSHQNAAASGTLLRAESGIWCSSVEPGEDMAPTYRIGCFRELDLDALTKMGMKMTTQYHE